MLQPLKIDFARRVAEVEPSPRTAAHLPALGLVETGIEEFIPPRLLKDGQQLPLHRDVEAALV